MKICISRGEGLAVAAPLIEMKILGMHVSIFLNGICCNRIDIITYFWTTLRLHVLSASSSSGTELPLMVES